MLKKAVSLIVFVGIIGIMVSGGAYALTLPDPTSVYDGIPITSQHDDFWSYSVPVMTELGDKKNLNLAELQGWNFATGEGGLDLLLYTGPGGLDNQQVGPDGPDADKKGDFYFEDPVLNSLSPDDGKTAFSGWWGQDDQLDDGTVTGKNGPVTVGNLLNYLHAFNPYNNIPVFYFDLNQEGGAAALTFVGRVYLYDAGADGIKGTADDGGIKHTWSFDNLGQPGDVAFPMVGLVPFVDGDYDPTATVVAPGEITLTGASGETYTVDHNLGSGKADFIAYAPTMDLSLYNPNWLFVTEYHLSNLNDGYEGLFLTGNIYPHDIVPEPATLLLMLSGLAGLAGIRRRKNSV